MGHRPSWLRRVARAARHLRELGDLLRRLVAPRLRLLPGVSRLVLSSETPPLRGGELVVRPRLRRGLAGHKPVEAIQRVISLLERYPSNAPSVCPWRTPSRIRSARRTRSGSANSTSRRASSRAIAAPLPPVGRAVTLPPPPATAEFAATVSAVPAAVLARSTWRRGCPVPVDQLRYLTVSFWGFDGRHHTGELIANSRIATRLVGVFEQLHNARFPIEEMRVVTAAELTAAPTGDGNNTQAFVCRQANGRSHWSAHAYGLAIDLNPFCNPYLLGDLVVPELASAYADRRWVRPGMVSRGDVAVRPDGTALDQGSHALAPHRRARLQGRVGLLPPAVRADAGTIPRSG